MIPGLLFAACLYLPGAHTAAETVRITAITAPATPWHDSWEHFETQLASDPARDLQASFYLQGQLGSEETALSQLRRGRVQLGGFSLQGASSVVPELGILMSPFLFRSFEEVDFVMDNYLLQAFDELFAAKGLVLLGWAEVGWTSLYARTPLLTPAVAQGLKLRSSNALASQLLIRSIGADMVPMAFPGILPALQTGLIQGGESGAILYALTGLPKAAPHLTLTRHAFDTGMYLANREWLGGLHPAQQAHLRASLMPAPAFRRLIRAYEARILDDPRRYGITLHQPGPEQLRQWRAATAGNRARLASATGGASARIQDLLESGLRAYRARSAEAAL
jgi:TRAP-type C4-dicarboxylate transport system substrate-binding protein